MNAEVRIVNASTPDSPAVSGAPRLRLRAREVHERRSAWSPGVQALGLIALLGCSAIASATPNASERSRSHAQSYGLPLTFETNQGQTDARVDFLARGENYTLFLTPTEAVFALSGRGAATVQAPKRNLAKGPAPEAQRSSRSVMRMQLVDSARDARVQGLEGLPGKVNYLRGNDSAQWRTNVRTYKRVRYTAVYPGIDLVYYGQPQQLEYDFIVAPGADPTAIKLAFAGIDDATVDARGDLVLKTAGGSLRFQKPVIYQTNGARRHPVEGGYVRMSPREVGFRLGSYDRSRPLIIDPVLSYSTYLGGSGEDTAEGIAVDATGAIYVSGTTGSTDFPTVDAVQPAPGGGVSDAFVLKLAPDGGSLIYATYLGGSASEGETHEEGRTTRIAVDAEGAAYVAGVTHSPDFPVVRAFQDRFKGDVDAFVAKLSADGSRLIYSTYLGGSQRDQYSAIALDSTGAAYISGSTFSTDFPTTASAFQPECTGLDSPENAFVAKLAPDGAALVYSTCLGGGGIDAARGITVDSDGAAYVVGITTSENFPTVNPVSAVKRGEWDSFVTKLAPDGNRLIYSTYLGGSDYEDGFGIALDASGAAYVIGETTSQDFPTKNPLQPAHGGSNPSRSDLDAYVVKLAPHGGALVYGTFLGGFEWDRGYSIAVDTAGAAYVAGFTGSRDFPTVDPLQVTLRGSRDAFVAKLDPDGTALVYSTYLGGSAGESHIGYMAMVIDPEGTAYVTGATQSRDFPRVSPLQPTFGGRSDAFVTKVAATAPLQPHVVFGPASQDFPAEPRDINFGEAVAIRDGIAFVGIPKAADGGHVAVLNLSASGWKRVGTIKLPQSVAQNIRETEFGRALTWRDGVLMVGGEKAAYYFSLRNGTWTFRDVLRPQFLSSGSAFPVALRYQAGDVDVAGLPHGIGTLLATEFAAPCCPSRVHIFHLLPTRETFFYVGFVEPSDSRAGDNFGADISMTNRAFVVGSPAGSRSRIAGLPAYDGSGAAYIFRRGTDGRWRQGQKLLPSEPAPGFGTSVAINNDMIVVGAPKIDIEGAPAGPDTIDGHNAGGAAYVFVPGGTRYVQELKLRPQPDELFRYQDFGYRVAMSGLNVAIAAVRPYEADGDFPLGLVVNYRRDGTRLMPRSIAAGHVVAASMGLSNNWLLLGVPYERSCPSGCVGSAHIYDLSRLAR
jgi:hypothetical protein